MTHGQNMTDAQIEDRRDEEAESAADIVEGNSESDGAASGEDGVRGEAANGGSEQGAHGPDEEPERTEMDTLREEFDALNDRHLRLVAEFNNFRRRSEQERLSAWSRAQADLVGRFLDVLDDLQRVAELDLSSASVDAIMEGIDLVERKFARSLEDAGVEMIDPAGQSFDPERMEAMMRVPAESEEHVDQVAQVFQKGYTLKGTLVRPARVSVFTQG